MAKERERSMSGRDAIKDAKECLELSPVEHAIHFLRHLVDHGYLPQMSCQEAINLIVRLESSSRAGGAPTDWISTEENAMAIPPMGEEIIVRLRDGSELHGAILQGDLDYWWRERFFDHDEITHWRAAAPKEGE
jgi:hypothetical protein